MLLVPSMLPVTKPADILDIFPTDIGPTGTHYMRRYKFEFVPSGMVSRFMVKMMKFANAKRYWRHGILIQSKTHENTYGLIELKVETVRSYFIISLHDLHSGLECMILHSYILLFWVHRQSMSVFSSEKNHSVSILACAS